MSSAVQGLERPLQCKSLASSRSSALSGRGLIGDGGVGFIMSINSHGHVAAGGGAKRLDVPERVEGRVALIGWMDGWRAECAGPACHPVQDPGSASPCRRRSSWAAAIRPPPGRRHTSGIFTQTQGGRSADDLEMGTRKSTNRVLRVMYSTRRSDTFCRRHSRMSATNTPALKLHSLVREPLDEFGGEKIPRLGRTRSHLRRVNVQAA